MLPGTADSRRFPDRLKPGLGARYARNGGRCAFCLGEIGRIPWANAPAPPEKLRALGLRLTHQTDQFESIY
jgi:hypothetical protein